MSNPYCVLLGGRDRRRSMRAITSDTYLACDDDDAPYPDNASAAGYRHEYQDFNWEHCRARCQSVQSHAPKHRGDSAADRRARSACAAPLQGVGRRAMRTHDTSLADAIPTPQENARFFRNNQYYNNAMHKYDKDRKNTLERVEVAIQQLNKFDLNTTPGFVEDMFGNGCRRSAFMVIQHAKMRRVDLQCELETAQSEASPYETAPGTSSVEKLKIVARFNRTKFDDARPSDKRDMFAKCKHSEHVAIAAENAVKEIEAYNTKFILYKLYEENRAR